MQVEAEKAHSNQGKGKAPSLGVLGKSSSADGKFSRTSLTRGGSQEDPVQLMRDLQDSMEREADIREQLKFAEEEVIYVCTSVYFLWVKLRMKKRCIQFEETSILNTKS